MWRTSYLNLLTLKLWLINAMQPFPGLADLKPPMFMFIKDFLSRSRLPLLKKEKVNILGCVSMQRIFNGGSSVSYGHLGGDTFLLSMVILLLPFQNWRQNLGADTFLPLHSSPHQHLLSMVILLLPFQNSRKNLSSFYDQAWPVNKL